MSAIGKSGAEVVGPGGLHRARVQRRQRIDGQVGQQVEPARRDRVLGSRNFVWASAMADQPYPPPMATRGVDHDPSVEQAVSLYAAGDFPMDDVTEAHNPLPFYAAERRALFELTRPRGGAAPRVRRSPRTGERTLAPVRDARFDEVLDGRARPREPGDGVWITQRLQGFYRRLHEAGLAHSFEIEPEGELAAGRAGVVLGRAAMLESMFHCVPDAGNVLLARTLDELASHGFVLCDIQLPTEHTTRMGARLVAREEYEARLRAGHSPQFSDGSIGIVERQRVLAALAAQHARPQLLGVVGEDVSAQRWARRSRTLRRFRPRADPGPNWLCPANTRLRRRPRPAHRCPRPRRARSQGRRRPAAPTSPGSSNSASTTNTDWAEHGPADVHDVVASASDVRSGMVLLTVVSAARVEDQAHRARPPLRARS